MRRECISGAKAAEILGVDRHTLKDRIRRGIWTFGEIVPARKCGGKYDRIIIWVAKLEAYIGRCVDVS